MNKQWERKAKKETCDTRENNVLAMGIQKETMNKRLILPLWEFKGTQ